MVRAILNAPPQPVSISTNKGVSVAAVMRRMRSVRSRISHIDSAARFRDELGIFNEWFAVALLDSPVPATVIPVFEYLVERMPSQLQCCVHRDYHCRNLLLIGEDAAQLAATFADCTEVEHADSLQAAVARAATLATHHGGEEKVIYR